MKSALFTWLRRPVGAVLKRPLGASEIGAMALMILAVGTVYCQLYCLVAFQQMHGQAMPVLTSIHRVSIDLVPAYVAFEAAKRVLQRERNLARIAVVVAIFIAAIAIAALARATLTAMTDPTTPVRKMVADRLPTLALAAVALLWTQIEARRSTPAEEPRLPPADAAHMPPAKFIESVRAAGNYVEVRFAGQTRLLRMPLRQVAAQLPETEFVQVHRSVIVNRAHIASYAGRRTILLTDGSEVRVGDAYRANLG